MSERVPLFVIAFALGSMSVMLLVAVVPTSGEREARDRACALALNHTAPTLSDSLRIAQDFPECEWWPAPDTETELCGDSDCQYIGPARDRAEDCPWCGKPTALQHPLGFLSDCGLVRAGEPKP